VCGVRFTVGSRRVAAPSGATWRIGRVWRGRGDERRRKPVLRWRDGGRWLPSDFGGVDSLEGLLVVVVVVVLVVFVVIPLLLFGIELIIIGIAFAASIVGRLFLGRPWIVAAESQDETREVLAWEVSGWRRSGRVIDEVARAISTGRDPKPRHSAERVVGAARAR
jgi:hypothetical protein